MVSQAVFPTLRCVSRIGQEKKNTTSSVQNNNTLTSIYDVKFYPYSSTPDARPVVAIVAAHEVVVFRPSDDPKRPIEILRLFRDPEDNASLNSIVWAHDLDDTGDPLLCFGGAGSSRVKVVNVTTGDFVRTLRGHGQAINDLAVSPIAPNILASGSADNSIRLWNLDNQHQKQPCIAIFAGAGHKGPVLSLAFHQNGKYLLTGGADNMVNLWAIPDDPGMSRNRDNVIQVHYPLFSSTEVHPDYVDCIRFYGDMIISHAAASSTIRKDNVITLWKIDGFNSADPVPTDPPIPHHDKHTTSAFGDRFRRILTFDMPFTIPFYMRFALFNGPGHRPILVMGNERSRFSFWDLQALEEGAEHPEQGAGKGPHKKRGRKPSSSATAAKDSNNDGSDTPDEAQADPLLDISDPFRPISPHHVVTVPKYDFAARQVAWSNDGKWCIGVGEIGLICIFKRWD